MGLDLDSRLFYVNAMSRYKEDLDMERIHRLKIL